MFDFFDPSPEEQVVVLIERAIALVEAAYGESRF